MGRGGAGRPDCWGVRYGRPRPPGWPRSLPRRPPRLTGTLYRLGPGGARGQGGRGSGGGLWGVVVLGCFWGSPDGLENGGGVRGSPGGDRQLLGLGDYHHLGEKPKGMSLLFITCFLCNSSYVFKLFYLASAWSRLYLPSWFRHRHLRWWKSNTIYLKRKESA